MCFKKPKLPQQTPADKKAEEELEAARLVRQRQIGRELKSEKDAQTEAALARALGFVGMRSLIAGPKGGAGYMGPGSGRPAGRNKIVPSAPPVSLLPPGANPGGPAIAGGGGSLISGYSGGGSGGGSKDGSAETTYIF